ncbi:NUDIX hydrolase [Desulfoscipio geothermicus]|uniref:ADP-ribose pyrophosphatase n=1 Tax=Desulfoscipio geothermicus DSM 3669 TaxID=1121426 RepID=A0A1I6D9E9_9FIRM|nr:NUDIX hydrolase [Desulfoscipio geothermicus]SFR02080.1 ADP-ribose pyrophosphatase [Desulfoscipio geothermicus DSM 3669]
MATEKTMTSETVFHGKIINVRRDDVLLPDGRPGTREVVGSADAVAVVAVTENREVLMVSQYRYPAGKEMLEIPAGKIEPGEQALECAQRELEEETGYRAGNWRDLYRFYTSPGFCTEQIHLYLAYDLTAHNQNPDQDEFIEVIKIPLEKALQMVESNEICDAKTITGLLAAVRYIEK